MIELDTKHLKEQVFSFLKNQPLAVLATVSEDGKPQAATVCYFIDDNWDIYLFTHSDSRKAKNLQKNSKVALVVGTIPSTQTAQIEGNGQVITAKDPGFSELLLKFASLPMIYNGPLLKIRGAEYIIVKVTINWLRWLDLDKVTGIEQFRVIFPE